MFATLLGQPIVATANDDTTGKRITDWKQTAINYAVSQGPSFILLTAIMVFLAYATIELVPKHLETINKGYERNAATLKDPVETIVKSHERDRELFEKIITERK